MNDLWQFDFGIADANFYRNGSGKQSVNASVIILTRLPVVHTATNKQ
jgi:hypothetical protein